MVDINDLERQLADESLRIVGPEPVVDDAAIFTAITTTQSPKWRFQSMFNATKFVVAGAIVALFGGFLLAGVLTQPSDEQMPAGVVASVTAPPDASSEATVARPIEVFARITHERGGPGSGAGRIEASDPRLTGNWSYLGLYEDFEGGDTADRKGPAAICDEIEDECDGPRQLRVRLDAQRIENDGGTWTSRPTTAWSVLDPGPSVPADAGVLLVFDGSDGYEGLVTVLYQENLDNWGFIVDADRFPSNPGGVDAPFPDVGFWREEGE